MFYFTHVRRGSRKNESILTYIAEDVDGVTTEKTARRTRADIQFVTYSNIKMTDARTTMKIKRWNRFVSNVGVESLFLFSFGWFVLLLSLKELKNKFFRRWFSTRTTPERVTQCPVYGTTVKKTKKSLRRPKFRPPSSAMFKKKESGPLPFQAPTSILRWLGESQRLPSRGNKKATKVVHYTGNVVL